jgi:hypothetical protein
LMVYWSSDNCSNLRGVVGGCWLRVTPLPESTLRMNVSLRICCTPAHGARKPRKCSLNSVLAGCQFGSRGDNCASQIQSLYATQAYRAGLKPACCLYVSCSEYNTCTECSVYISSIWVWAIA